MLGQRLSRFGSASQRPSPVNRMMAEFATGFRDGIDVNLGVGYVDERTIPGELIREALDAVLADPVHYRQPFNYGDARGLQTLIEAIIRFHDARNTGGLDRTVMERNAIIVGPSGATSLLQGFSEVIEPGIVITSDPMYYIYCDALERRGFEIVAIPEDDQGVDPDRLERKLRELSDEDGGIAFFYFVTVSNPTCSVLSNARRKRIVEIVSRLSREQNRAIPLIFDHAYELLRHDPALEPFQSALSYDALGIVYEVSTLSKILAPALRIGYVMGPPGPIMDALTQLTSDTGFSAPLINQAIAAYLLDHHAGAQIDRVNAGYHEKARATRRAIGEHLLPYIEHCVGGRAGFYYYLTLREIETHAASPFFRCLSRAIGDEAVDGPSDAPRPRVVYLPGEHCVHSRGQLVKTGRRQLRLSYGFEDMPAIEKALELMRQAADFVRDSSRP